MSEVKRAKKMNRQTDRQTDRQTEREKSKEGREKKVKGGGEKKEGNKPK